MERGVLQEQTDSCDWKGMKKWSKKHLIKKIKSQFSTKYKYYLLNRIKSKKKKFKLLGAQKTNAGVHFYLPKF